MKEHDIEGTAWGIVAAKIEKDEIIREMNDDEMRRNEVHVGAEAMALARARSQEIMQEIAARTAPR